MDKYKWRIEDVQIDNGQTRLIVEFAYAWKEETIETEEGTTTNLTAQKQREVLTVPVVLSPEQIVQHLDVYWANKYGPLDALATTLNQIQGLKGYVKSY